MATQAKTTKKDSFEIDYDQVYKFKLTTPHEGRYIIQSESLAMDDNGKRRQIRYSEIEDSPYVDEQDEDAPVSSRVIEFIKGELHVKGSEASKIRYLLAHEGNADKAKKMPYGKPIFSFRMIDQASEFKNKAAHSKLVLKVQSALVDATKTELADFLKVEYGYKPVTNTHEELLEMALAKAKENPEFVNKNFNTEESKTKAIILRALEAGTLRESNGSLFWTESGKEIATFKIKEGEKLVDHVWEWITKESKEAKEFAKQVDSKLV